MDRPQVPLLKLPFVTRENVMKQLLMLFVEAKVAETILNMVMDL